MTSPATSSEAMASEKVGIGGIRGHAPDDAWSTTLTTTSPEPDNPG
jgi:hypothetical protein